MLVYLFVVMVVSTMSYFVDSFGFALIVIEEILFYYLIFLEITSANIASLPHLRSVNLEYQKTPSIIQATKAHAAKDTAEVPLSGAKTGLVKTQTQHQTQVNRLQKEMQAIALDKGTAEISLLSAETAANNCCIFILWSNEKEPL